MGTIGNLSLNSVNSRIQLQNNGMIGNTQVQNSGGGQTLIENNGFMQNTSSAMNTCGKNDTGTTTIVNNGQMTNVSSRANGTGSNFNFQNNGLTSNLNTRTYHGGVTNIANTQNGYIDNTFLYDSKDQTNVQNFGAMNDVKMQGYWQGEFNFYNGETGAVNNMTTENIGTRPGSTFRIQNDGLINNANINSTGGSNVTFNNSLGTVMNFDAFADNQSRLDIFS